MAKLIKPVTLAEMQTYIKIRDERETYILNQLFKACEELAKFKGCAGCDIGCNNDFEHVPDTSVCAQELYINYLGKKYLEDIEL